MKSRPQCAVSNSVCGWQFSSAREDTQAPSPKAPALPVSWLNQMLPAKALPYAYLMRLDKPIGNNSWCLWFQSTGVLTCDDLVIHLGKAEQPQAYPHWPPQHCIICVCRHLVVSLAMFLVNSIGSSCWQPARSQAAGSVWHWSHSVEGCRLHS